MARRGERDRRAAAPASSGWARPATPSGAASPTRSEYQLAVEAIAGRRRRRRPDPRRRRRAGSFAEDRNEADLRGRRPRHCPSCATPACRGSPAEAAPAPRWPTRPWPSRAAQAEAVVVYRSLCQGQFRRFGQGPGNRAPAPGRPATRAPALRRATEPARGPRRLHHALRHVQPAHRLRHGPAAPHAPVRHHRRADGPRGGDHPGPRGAQPPGGDGRPAHDDGRLPGVAHGVGAVPPLRLLPRERRRLRGGGHHAPSAPPTCAKAPVAVLGAAQGTLRGFGHGQYSNVDMPDDDYTSAGARAVAARLWARAGIGPADVDVAQIYDHFTGLVLLSLEDFGFCGRGEGGPFAGVGRAGLARRGAAHQHPRRQPVGGLHPRAQPRRRGRAPAPGRVDLPGRRGRDLPGDERGRRAHQCAGAGTAR